MRGHEEMTDERRILDEMREKERNKEEWRTQNFEKRRDYTRLNKKR